MSLPLKRIKLKSILESNQRCPTQPSRELMLELIDSFYVSTSPFHSEKDFYDQLKSSMNWMEHCARFADESWLDTLNEIYLNPPEEEYCGWREEFEHDFNTLLEKIAELFPEKASEVFGEDCKGFLTPD